MNNYCIFVLIYVDDLLICGSCENQITKFKALLHKNFKMKDLGIANNFLGININQNIDNGVVILNQKKYLEKILQKFQMLNCKEISTPIEQNLKFDILNRTHSENEQIENKCRQLIGSLLYACSATRPDLCVAVSFLSRYQHCASQMLYKFLKRVLRYVKGTLNLSLIYKCNQKGNLIGNVDADWAGDTKDRKSTSGFIFKIFNCPVSWCTKKQLSVSLSSTEAEYIALSVAITEGCWLKYLLNDFGYEMMIDIFEDNQSVIKIAQNNESNKRLKHLDIRYHFIVEKVTNKKVRLNYIKSNENVADLFTKPLGKQMFIKFRNEILFNNN